MPGTRHRPNPGGRDNADRRSLKSYVFHGHILEYGVSWQQNMEHARSVQYDFRVQLTPSKICVGYYDRCNGFSSEDEPSLFQRLCPTDRMSRFGSPCKGLRGRYLSLAAQRRGQPPQEVRLCSPQKRGPQLKGNPSETGNGLREPPLSVRGANKAIPPGMAFFMSVAGLMRSAAAAARASRSRPPCEGCHDTKSYVVTLPCSMSSGVGVGFSTTRPNPAAPLTFGRGAACFGTACGRRRVATTSQPFWGHIMCKASNSSVQEPYDKEVELAADAHKWRLMQAEKLLAAAGYEPVGDGTWRLPA